MMSLIFWNLCLRDLMIINTHWRVSRVETQSCPQKFGKSTLLLIDFSPVVPTLLLEHKSFKYLKNMELDSFLMIIKAISEENISLHHLTKTLLGQG
jgi:hypothetical protein